MSWSLSTPEIRAATVADARSKIEQNAAPQPIKDYVLAGIDGLVARFGEGVLVTISGHGHLCDGPSSYEVTSATIDVRKAE